MVRKKIKEILPIPLKLTELFSSFFESSKAGGMLLIIATVISLILANTQLSDTYIQFWETELHLNFLDLHFPHSLLHWINDGLMAIFFLLVGLEIKRELLIGELNTVKSAMLPVMAAIGGMLIPALIFSLINKGHGQYISGAGIPTATDIAFAIAILSILGDKIPNSFKVFLTALAIIDDLGAILIIAIFYGGHIEWVFLIAAGLTAGLMLFFNKKNITNIYIYVALGIILWVFTMQSGIHSTIAGVVMAFCIPFGNGDKKSLSSKIESQLQRPVNFAIMPLFALANTAIFVSSTMAEGLVSTLSIGVFMGLFIGKPLGIFGGAMASSRLGLSEINDNITRKMIIGGGFLGGIGFTMSIFVTNLAFNEQSYINIAKLSIILASVAAASVGYFILSKKSK